MDVKERAHEFRFTYGDDGDEEQVCAFCYLCFINLTCVPFILSVSSSAVFFLAPCEERCCLRERGIMTALLLYSGEIHRAFRVICV